LVGVQIYQIQKPVSINRLL